VIRTLFKKNKIKEQNVGISTGGHSVVIKTITTAKAPEKELHASIHSEAEQYIPYDIDDVNIDYHVLGESDFAPEQLNVLLVAAKKDLVAEYIDLIHMAGLYPAIIDVDTFALQNIYETLPDENREKITLLIDIGFAKTSLNILQNNTSLMMRDNLSGSKQIIEEMISRTGCTIEEAELAVSGQDHDRVSSAITKEICNAVANDWCGEIHEVVRTFHSNSSDKTIEKVIISGGSVFTPGFIDSLSSELGIDISVINPFEGLIVDSKSFDDAFITSVSPQAPIALGLALRRLDDK
jgi:type IV pilus assembly protein PilM